MNLKICHDHFLLLSESLFTITLLFNLCRLRDDKARIVYCNWTICCVHRLATEGCQHVMCNKTRAFHGQNQLGHPDSHSITFHRKCHPEFQSVVLIQRLFLETKLGGGGGGGEMVLN
jgi:hypothetical protein